MSETTSHSNGITIYTGNRDVVMHKLDDLPGGRVYIVLEGCAIIGVFGDIIAACELAEKAELEVEQ